MMRRCYSGWVRSLVLAGVLIAIVPFSTVQAQERVLPAKTVRLIVPFPPGSAADISARLLGDGLSRQ